VVKLHFLLCVHDLIDWWLLCYAAHNEPVVIDVLMMMVRPPLQPLDFHK